MLDGLSIDRAGRVNVHAHDCAIHFELTPAELREFAAELLKAANRMEAGGYENRAVMRAESNRDARKLN